MLTCYRLSAPGAHADFADFLVDDRQGTDSSGAGYRARLFVIPTEEKPPTWEPFVTSLFPRARIDDGGAPSALVLVRLTRPVSKIDGHRGTWFAFTFGTRGRYLLDSSRIVSGYGLRIALNLVYPSGTDGTARLRSLESKRHGATVIRSRSQSSAPVNAHDFEVRSTRDLLNRVTGAPRDAAWGSTVTGSDAFTFTEARVHGLGLAALCRLLDETYRKSDYQSEFGWIDHVRAVTDDALATQLEQRILEQIRTPTPSLVLAAPEILRWDEIQRFEHARSSDPSAPRVADDTPRLASLLSTLGGTGDDITTEKLKRARLIAQGDTAEIGSWSAWKCLVGQVVRGNRTYILDEGRFFEVDADYLRELNRFVQDLDERSLSSSASVLTLADARPKEEEDDYNTRIKDGATDVLLLDRHATGIPGGRTTVEICDLLTTNRQLVHVKRHLGSATLSHLFAQGLVSAELLQSSPAYRKSTMNRIRDQGTAGDRRFEFFNGPIDTRRFEVIYAIVAEWAGRSLVAALPFFSKVNLRESVSALDNRGYGVTVRKVEVSSRASSTPTSPPVAISRVP